MARYTLLEALRTRFPIMVLVAVALLLLISFFVEALAVTESARFQASVYAAGMRLAGVFIAALYVLVSIARELNDKGFDIVLALDLPRAHYVLGKLLGFLALAAVVAVVAGLPLLFLAPWEAVLQWVASLTLELAIVVALALFCMLTFSQLVPAASFVAAFYLLARSITSIRLMGAYPLAGAESLSHQVMSTLVEALALVTPAFDQWTETAWLVNQPAAWPALLAIGWQSVIYVLLLAAAAMFDLYRKNF
jgi:ABC-type transport system involved in multi-copper enzyme maturation permease subunit